MEEVIPMQVPPDVREAAVSAFGLRRSGLEVLDLVRDSRMHDYPRTDEDEQERVLLFGRGQRQIEVRIAQDGAAIEVTADFPTEREIGLEVVSTRPGLHLAARGKTPLTVAGVRGPSSLIVTQWNEQGVATSRQTSWVIL